MSSLTQNLFFQYFFFFNESGLLSRVGQLGDMTIYINGIRRRFYTTWDTSLPTVCDKTCASFNGLFSFPIPVFPLEQGGASPKQ